MVTGWVKAGGKWEYYKSSGARVTDGWVKSGGKWYYIADGVMVSGTVREIGGETYRFDTDGAMVTGWLQIGGKWEYYKSSGARVNTGWAKSGSKWYYLKDGVLQTGWVTMSDGVSTYYLDGDGVMQTGWKKLGGEWYYFDSSGLMLTGWHELGDYTYFFYRDSSSGHPRGAMADDTVIEGTTIRPGGYALTQAEINMRSKAQKYYSSTSWIILVDTSACKVGIFSGSSYDWTLKYYWACAPGKPSTPTVTGTFTVGSKGTYFDSSGARCWWYTQFYGNYLFHSVLYYPDGSLMDGRTNMQLSHGCVRLAYDRARWIYDNIPTGTRVVIY